MFDISFDARKLAHVRSMVVLAPLLEINVGLSFCETKRKPFLPHEDTKDLLLCGRDDIPMGSKSGGGGWNPSQSR